MGRIEGYKFPVEESHVIESTVLHHADFVPTNYDFNLLNNDIISTEYFPLYNSDKNYQ